MSPLSRAVLCEGRSRVGPISPHCEGGASQASCQCAKKESDRKSLSLYMLYP